MGNRKEKMKLREWLEVLEAGLWNSTRDSVMGET
jgi:hypothetical protein